MSGLAVVMLDRHIPSRPIRLGTRRRSARKGELRATRNVTVCEECFVQALSRSKVPGKVFAALRERLSAVYNSMRAGDK